MHRSFLFLVIASVFSLESMASGKIATQSLDPNTLFVDEYNALWIGTKTGLFEWRHNAAVRTPIPGELNVTALYACKGNVLIGTRDGQVIRYEVLNQQIDSIGKLGSEISSITRRGSTFCIATKGHGYFRIDPFGIEQITVKKGLNDQYLYDLQFDADGTIWSSSDRGLSVDQGVKAIVPFALNHLVPDRLVTCFEIHDSFLYCGTQLGDVCRINLNDSSFYLYNKSNWESAQVNDLIVLDNHIAITTEQGAYILDKEGRNCRVVSGGKPFYKVVYDREANLWFCGEGIVMWTLGEQMNVIQSIGSYTLKNLHALCCVQPDLLFLTTDDGMTRLHLGDSSIRVSELSPADDHIEINSLYLDARGKLWVGTSGGGLFLIDTATLKRQQIMIDNSGETSTILSLTGDASRIWFSSLNGVWYSEDQQSPYHFHSLEDEFGMKRNYVYQVTKDRDNALWLATDGQGMLQLKNKRLLNVSLQHKISAKVFYSMEEDGAGQKWFNAYNDGLYCLSKDSVIHLTMQQGLSSNDIISLSALNDDCLIAVTLAGVDLIDIHQFALTHIPFESMAGTPVPEANAIAKNGRNGAYIASNTGLIDYYLPSYKTQFSPQACIESKYVMGYRSIPGRNTFPANQNFFRFSINAHCNTGLPVYYRYKLNGLNEQWRVTTDKEIVFPRLNPGHYELMLQAANNRSFNNATQDNWAFVIEFPFWQKKWFILLTLSTLSLVLFLLIRFREQRIQRVQQLEKEKAIAEFVNLKHQVSPHFLFNSFNTLIQVIDEDKEKAIEYAQMLSDFYRSLISYRDVDLVSLDEELTLLNQYIYLQTMRFGDSLRFEQHVSEEQRKHSMIPPLTLQLLAENAVKHNTISTSKPLFLTVKTEGNYLCVENNVNQKQHQEPGEKIGLQNIRNRFSLFTSHPVEIIETDQTFIVRLPLLKL